MFGTGDEERGAVLWATMPRSVNYPLDVNAQFTLSQFNDFHTTLKATGSAAGFLQNAEGDLHTWVVFDEVREVWQRAYVTEAYADLIDANVVAVKEETDGLKLALADLQTRVTSLQQTCASLAASMAQVSGFLGVVIPAWINKTEVSTETTWRSRGRAPPISGSP